MAGPKEYIGTGEELEPYLKQQPKQLFKLIPLPEGEVSSTPERLEAREVPSANGAAQGEKTLAEMFAGRVGRVSFDPSDVSTRAEEYVGKIIAEKHAKRRAK